MDSKTNGGVQDAARIRIERDEDVRDWSRRFGVAPEELKKAVAAVGDRADAVEAHLKARPGLPKNLGSRGGYKSGM